MHELSDWRRGLHVSGLHAALRVDDEVEEIVIEESSFGKA